MYACDPCGCAAAIRKLGSVSQSMSVTAGISTPQQSTTKLHCTSTVILVFVVNLRLFAIGDLHGYFMFANKTNMLLTNRRQPSILCEIIKQVIIIIIIIIIRKFIARTWSSIKHESEARAVARWPDGVC